MVIVKLLAKSLLISSLLLVSGGLFALSDDYLQPINIEADNLEIDETRRISVYSGQVRMRQGSLDMKAEQITMHFDANNNLLHMDMVGDPASFRQQSDQGEEIRGSALNIHYRETDGVMELKNNAIFQNGQDRIESDFIRSNLRDNSLQAGEQEGTGRVRMTIQPKNKDSE